MNRKLLITLVAITIIICSYFIEYSSFIWIAIIIINLLFIFTVFIIWIFKKNKVSKKIRSSLILISLFSIGVFINSLLPYKNLNFLNDSKLSIPEKIKFLYDSDQSDRKHLKSYTLKKYSLTVNKRDVERLETAKKYFSQYKNGKLKLDNQDKFYLAMIFHHGKETEDFKIAYQLASEIVESKEEIRNAPWLKKATYDRLLISQGKPQKYGTQH